MIALDDTAWVSLATAMPPAPVQEVAAAPESGPTPPDAEQSVLPAAPAGDPPPPPPAPVSKGLRLPFGRDRALARGYELPRTAGLSILLVGNHQKLDAGDLAVAIGTPAGVAGRTLTPVPFVTTDQIKAHNHVVEFKADVWLFPYLNLFASIGRANGGMDIAVNIDLTGLLPPVLCRPPADCSRDLRFHAEIDNTTLTFGGMVSYGAEDWFAALLASRTLSMSSRDRSDITSTDAGLRVGPRLKLPADTRLALYGGVNYVDLDTTVEGSLSGEVRDPAGAPLTLRYRTSLRNPWKWSALVGANFEFARRWNLQAEQVFGKGGDRTVVSASVRF